MTSLPSNQDVPQSPDSPHPDESRKNLFLSGSTWMVATRFGVRSIGLLSTVILARVLVPADFGVVAMAMLVIGFIEVFSETGQALALIRHENPQRAHYDSAWTMAIIINTGLTLVILVVAPLSGAYFNDDRIIPVIQALSLRVFLGGFVNIGVVNFRRDLDFVSEFRFGLYRKLLTFGVTLTFALTLQSYWALVLGVVTGHVLEVALSYLMHPYRPRWCLEKVSELWSYSIWLLVAALGRFFEGRVDGVVVAGVFPPSAVGQYTVAAELGALPVTEILDPATRALFPNYARVAAQPGALRESYLQVLAVTATIAAAVGTGISLASYELTTVLLGAKWTDTAPLIAWFAIEAAIVGICNSVFPVMNAAGESRQSAIQTWVRVAIYVPGMLWAASTGELINFAKVKVFISILLVPTFFIRLRQVIPMSWSDLIAAVWRAPVAAAVMAAVVISLEQTFAAIGLPFFRLLAITTIGAVAYISTQLLLWLMVGRPKGVEQTVLEMLKLRR